MGRKWLFAHMKDAGDTDGVTTGGMEGGVTQDGEEGGSGETEPVCESLESGRKVRTRESFSFTGLVFFGGTVLRMFYVQGNDQAMRKRATFQVSGEMRKFSSRLYDSRYWDCL